MIGSFVTDMRAVFAERQPMTGTDVDSRLPHGVNLASDLRRKLPALRVNVIFDVGANIGQSIREFVLDYAGARILSFEPDPNTFRTLKSSYGNHRQVSLHNMALSDRSGRLYFDDTSPVSEIHAIAKDQNNTALPLVDVTTIDQFCSDYGIERVSLLKIDTEGNDLNVIRGASGMLRRGLIDVIFAECSLMQTSRRLVSFSALQSAMREYGYVCFGIYDQSFGERAGDMEINWGNCAFVKGIE
jgi:FkbM family methyltransferase